MPHTLLGNGVPEFLARGCTRKEWDIPGLLVCACVLVPAQSGLSCSCIGVQGWDQGKDHKALCAS